MHGAAGRAPRGFPLPRPWLGLLFWKAEGPPLHPASSRLTRKCCQFVSQPVVYVHHAPFFWSRASLCITLPSNLLRKDELWARRLRCEYYSEPISAYLHDKLFRADPVQQSVSSQGGEGVPKQLMLQKSPPRMSSPHAPHTPAPLPSGAVPDGDLARPQERAQAPLLTERKGSSALGADPAKNCLGKGGQKSRRQRPLSMSKVRGLWSLRKDLTFILIAVTEDKQ